MAKSIKDIILRAFEFKSTKISKKTIDIFSGVKNKLENTKAEERVMILNQDDDSAESDLISNFSIKDTNIFSTMMRISPGADDAHIESNLMKKTSFSVAEIRKTKNDAVAIYKNHYYICFNNKYLITTLPQTTTIKRVETYLNWLVDDHIYELSPLIVKSPDLTFSDVTSVIFRNKNIGNLVSDDFGKVENKIFKLAKEFVEKFFSSLVSDTKSLADIDLNQVVSAELKFSLAKPKKASSEDIQKFYSAILKPVSDTDNLTFRDKKGNKITGDNLLQIKKVFIERTEQGFLQEPQLYIEMAKFIDELTI